MNDAMRRQFAAMYHQAVITNDFATEEKLWKVAENDLGLCEAFEQVHANLLREMDAESYIPESVPPN